MKEFMMLVSGERGMLARAALVATGIVIMTLAAGQGVIALITLAIPDQTQRISANAVPPSPRTYTVTRSVMDNTLTTGSISRPAGVRVDPCKN
jgi:hypothetical protein